MAQPKDRRDELITAAKPLIKHLAENFNPHTIAIVTATGVEVLTGELSAQDITEFLRD